MIPVSPISSESRRLDRSSAGCRSGRRREIGLWRLNPLRFVGMRTRRSLAHAPACKVKRAANAGRRSRYVSLPGWIVSFVVPHVVIDGVRVEARRLMLAPAEVAGVLGVGEAEVSAMVDRGELRDVSSEAAVRLDPNEVIALTERRVQGGELGKHVYVELAALVSTPL